MPGQIAFHQLLPGLKTVLVIVLGRLPKNKAVFAMQPEEMAVSVILLAGDSSIGYIALGNSSIGTAQGDSSIRYIFWEDGCSIG